VKEASSSARNSRRAVSARNSRSAGASNSGTRWRGPVRSGTWAAEASSVMARCTSSAKIRNGEAWTAHPCGPSPRTVPNVPGSSSNRSSAAGSPRSHAPSP
jgi:hypothetical protein